MALTFAAAIMVGIWPYILGNASFQLSFLAMARLVFIFPENPKGSGNVYKGDEEIASVRYELSAKGSPDKPAIFGRIFVLSDDPSKLHDKDDLMLYMQENKIRFIKTLASSLTN